MVGSSVSYVPKGRYARGEETRQRIMETAVEIFGSKGFTDTSTRDIAAAAGINTPAIQYYFDSKLGLYTACIDQLTLRIWGRIGPSIDACHATLAKKPSIADVIAAASAVQHCLIDSFFANSEGLAIRRLLAWADAENSTAAPGLLMKDRIGLPIFEAFRAIVEYVSPAPMNMFESDMHANALAGTSMIFHIDRTHFFDIVACDPADEMFIAAFKSVASTHLAFALIGLSKKSADDGVQDFAA